MNRVYRLVWNRSLAMFVPVPELARAQRKTRRSRGARRMGAGLLATLLAAAGPASATAFLDFTNGISDWTTGGNITLHNTTLTVPTGGPTFTLTPAAGYEMARINAPNNGNLLSPNATLGLSANSLENFLNNSDGNVTNFGLMTKSFAFNVGTYSFAWAYGAEDYQPYNDGAVFTLSGGGTQSLISLARNGSSPSDLSGPSPNTLILGSYGATPWLTLSFDIATAGTYQLGFAVYNWDDKSLAPNLYISGVEGTYSGTPAQVSGGTLPPAQPVVIGGTGGNVSGSVFDTSSPAYSEPTLSFAGGTLQYTSDSTTTKDAVLTGAGGAIDTGDKTVDYTGVISGTSDFYKEGSGKLTLTNGNIYSGKTTINGGTLALSGSGNIAASSSLVNNGMFDISGVSSGTSVQTISGTGIVELGTKTLQLSNASNTFDGTIKGTGSLTLGAGVLTLSGANTFSGTTTIQGGSLKLIGLGTIAASNGVVNDGTLDISDTTSGATVKTISGTGVVQLGTKNLSVSNGAGTFAGTIDGAGSVDLEAGELTLSGENTYTGPTIIKSGSLKLSGPANIASSSGVVNNGILDISASISGISLQTLGGSGIVKLGSKSLTIDNASGSYGGSFSGEGTVYVTAGTLELSGSSIHTGGTSVSGGAKVIVSDGAALGDVASTLTLDNGVLASTASLTLNRNVTISGASKFDTIADTALTATGPISGSGDLIKDGFGTLVLASDNSAFGTSGQPSQVIVNEGGLIVANSKGLGGANVILNSGTLQAATNLTIGTSLAVASGTAISSDAGAVMVVSAPIVTAGSGNACFEKRGSGTLVMTGHADIEPGTCVENGKLYANGVLNSVVTVQSDGVLRGTGVIVGETTVYGRLAPGNSPGLLQTTASVTMTAGSVYQEDINGLGTDHGPGSYSRLIITGAGNQFVATGATLEPNLANITGSDTYTPYVPKLGDAFRIITAEGGIVGRFENLTQPEGLAADTRVAAYYNVANSNSIDLFIVPTSYGTYVSDHGGNANAQSSAAALDSLVEANAEGTATAAQEALIYTVSAQNESTLQAVSTSLSGEVHGALIAAAPLADTWLVDTVGRQLTRGLALEGGHGVWVDVGANRSDWKSDAVASGFDTTRSQLALGWDLFSNRSVRIGVGFTHGKVDVSSATGSGSVTQDMGFIYGQAEAGRLIVDAAAGYGASDWETSRRDPLAPITSLSTDFGGHDTLISAGVRLPLQSGPISISPYARTLWQRVSRDGFSEDSTSLAALSTGDYSASGTRFSVGVLGGSREQQPLASRSTYQFNAGVGRDDSKIAQPVFAATLGGMNTTIATPDVGRTFGFAKFDATARLTKHMYTHFGVSAETRSGKNEDLGANLGVRMVF